MVVSETQTLSKIEEALLDRSVNQRSTSHPSKLGSKLSNRRSPDAVATQNNSTEQSSLQGAVTGYPARPVKMPDLQVFLSQESSMMWAQRI